MARVLIIDDDRMVCSALGDVAEHLGHRTFHAFTLKEGLKRLASESFDVVFLDVHLPDGDGLAVIPGIRAAPSSPEVIIVTGQADPDGAELAIKSGAWDYIEKPLTVQGITLTLVRTLQYRGGRQERKASFVLKREGIIGESAGIRECLDLLARAASSDMSVLLSGETGTGKELFATAIHRNSARSAGSFVVVDCAALPETLVESVLFGHVKGAFTGADKAHQGLVKQAAGGTLFLDEIGELPFSVQKAFLRVLQEKRFRPVGSQVEDESDFRPIAATNRDLERMALSGRFRKDLLFRIRTMIISLPPLRDRVKDIRELAMYYMARFCDRYGMGTKGFSPEFIEALCAYGWPGNVRELVNTMENVLATAGDDPVLFPKHLPTSVRVELARASLRSNRHRGKGGGKAVDAPAATEKYKDFKEHAVMEAEKRYLINLMSEVGWDVGEACRVSELSRPRLYALLKKHRITRAS
ncbi:MAG: sigma-54-dependent Fis family transcriptional regulator [Deltaproteobacteria bacterium]|nr:sigma-54-dependent Fis family transcriptional regulator [Deltaproteobacteria bacterium]